MVLSPIFLILFVVIFPCGDTGVLDGTWSYTSDTVCTDISRW